MAEDKETNIEEIEGALEGHCVCKQTNLQLKNLKDVINDQGEVGEENLDGHVQCHKGSPGQGDQQLNRREREHVFKPFGKDQLADDGEKLPGDPGQKSLKLNCT